MRLTAGWLTIVSLVFAGFLGKSENVHAQSSVPLSINGSSTSLVLPISATATIVSDSNAMIFAYISVDCSGPTALPASKGRLETMGTQPSQMSFQAELNGSRSPCLWVRWRDASAVPELSINTSTTVTTGTEVTASIVGADSSFLTSEVLFFDNATCGGGPLYQAPKFLTITSYQHGFTGSFQAVYTDVTEDFGQTTIQGYAGNCVPVTWAYDGVGGVPASPVPGMEGAILVAAGTADGDSGSGEPVVALPNTGAGQSNDSSLIWVFGGVLTALAIASLLLRNRLRRRS